MKKICVIYTGGTFGMTSSLQGLKPSNNLNSVLEQKLRTNHLAKKIPKYELLTQSSLIDSSEIKPIHWLNLTETILQKYNHYVGFVILHGTDTMSYSASMLSYTLLGLKKPIIFTGTQTPLYKSNTSAIENFVGALCAASNSRIKEVCIYCNQYLLRGNRTTKINTLKPHAFHSFNFPILGYGCHKIKFNKSFPQTFIPISNFSRRCDTKSHVMPFLLFPGINTNLMTTILRQPYKAFILMTYGTGNGPSSNSTLIKALTSACASGKIIVNLSQCPIGPTKPETYLAGTILQTSGLLNGYDMTLEACFCKLQYLCSQKISPENVKNYMNKNLCGEVTLPI